MILFAMTEVTNLNIELLERFYARSIDREMAMFEREFRALLVATDLKAQIANDMLERLLVANIKANETLVNTRFASQEAIIARNTQDIENRFKSINEFRDTLAGQTMNFVPRHELTAKIDQISLIISGIRDHIQTAITLGVKQREEMSERIIHMESKFYLGGAGIMILLTALQFVFNVWPHH